jgi:DNA polymerase-3 subunit alpha (Gram-positive type)
MIELADKKLRFELLLKQMDLPLEWLDTYFQETFLHKVVCSESNNSWTIFISSKQILPVDIYKSFSLRLKEQFGHIDLVETSFMFPSSTYRDIIEEYWTLFLEWLLLQEPTCNGWVSKSKIKVTHNQVELQLLDMFSMEQAKKKNIDQFIKTYFSNYFTIELQVTYVTRESIEDELGLFAKQIEKEEQAVLQQYTSDKPLSKKPQRTEKVSAVLAGNQIKDGSIAIREIMEERKKTTIQGYVFKFEQKELKNGSQLISFYISDYSDSFMVKCFAKTKEELKSYQSISNGIWLKCRGKIEFDKYLQPPELIMIPSDMEEITDPFERHDDADQKRVEFHLHTNMSTMDGITPIESYIQQAAKWGHQAIAITDHNGVQAYPDAHKAAKKYGMKMIYGVEAQVVNDSIPIVMHATNDKLQDATYVVYDIETTGLSIRNHKIIEIAAIKIKNGKEISRFETFINPHEKIPYAIQQLTHINDEMVEHAPELVDKLPEFVEFVQGCVLVAHNARFDMGFIQANLKILGYPELKNTVLDTLEFARFMYPNLKNHRLNTLADKFKVSLDQHHRAIYDTLALSSILNRMIEDALEQKIDSFEHLNLNSGKVLLNQKPFHCNIYAQNAIGKKNLYTLISLSHTTHFQKVPCIPKSVLADYREGLLISSGCDKGELFETVLNKSAEEAELVAQFYDVLEIQPIPYAMHIVDKGFVENKFVLEHVVKQICELGKKLNKNVIATGNVHYLHPQDKINRDITIHGITGFSPLKDMNKPDAHLMTTSEMLDQFAFLGDSLAYQVVVQNTQWLANQFEPFQLFPDQLYTPIIQGADEEIRLKCYETAKKIYGDELPQIIQDRLEKELQPIIKYGFSAIYLISERLVKKSNQDGYLVGSRGSVGSSLVAMMLGISEVNPLPAHYICKSCQYSRWYEDGSVPSGYDLTEDICPACGDVLKGDGHDIPFETFLGFAGDKVPDIDLNFSGEYQVHAHQYTKELFGEKNVFRAGTIGTVADRTAFGFVKKYEEDHMKHWRTSEVVRLSEGCTGVKRSTGQHPGGIVVVPEYLDINEITPVQFPADDKQSDWQTTHFDYHAFDANLLKLDILGHDDPTMMRMLQDLTQIDPQTISMNDSRVMSIFHTTEGIGVKAEQIRSAVATYGIPEMGTRFVRQMLEETHPSSFADLLQISGLSHGTGVWLGNAQELIRKKICTIKTVIGCRDDIMLFLIYKAGMDAALAFKITESVRKGKGLTDEWKQAMKDCKVPDWYIDSCERIEYMFPKAHATAYVISAFRTAYYKVYYPIQFYASYFSIRVQDFDLDVLCSGYETIRKKLIEIEEKNFQATPKEKSMISILEVALEMTARGFAFKPVDLYRSDATRFVIEGDSIIAPFSAVAGIGENAAKLIAQSRKEGTYLSVEDFQSRSKVSKTIIELLSAMGCFRELPDTNQLSLF